MVINHNIPAMFTHLNMRRADRGLQQAMMRLSSGMRINSAREDAAGLAISNKLSYQVGGLNRASDNATHGISLIQTAEGALNEVHEMLHRMRELAVQAATDTLTPQNRALIQLEIEELTNEIQTIARRTEFNRMRILNGEADRITENSFQNAAGVLQATRSIVTTLLVSREVPPGTLNYTIQQAGRGAVVGFTPDLLPPDPAADLDDPESRYRFANDGGFNINGIRIGFRAGEAWDDVRARLNEQLSTAGISLHENPDFDPAGALPQFFFVTDIAGSSQSINVTGDLAVLGLTPATASDTGLDAIIHFRDFPAAAPTTTGGLLDVNGNPVPGATLAANSIGNQVFIRGSGGEDIRINVQVKFDPALGTFVFPATVPGATPADPPVNIRIDQLGTPPFAEGIHMEKVFRDFGPIMLQIGPSHNTAMPVQIPRLNAETLGLIEYVGGIRNMLLDYRHIPGATAAMEIADRAILTVSQSRARLGAYQNRLESTVRNLDVAAENTEVSRSRIMDADVARESTRLAQFQVQFQAAMAILGQANQRPQQIISLLQ